MLMLFVVVFRKKPRFVPSYCCHFLIFCALGRVIVYVSISLSGLAASVRLRCTQLPLHSSSTKAE